MSEQNQLKQMAKIIGKFIGFREMKEDEHLNQYLDEMENFSPEIELIKRLIAKGDID